MKKINIELHFSTAFHPKSDGLAEVINCILEQLLLLHCSEVKWLDQLPMLALLYNAIPQSWTWMSPLLHCYWITAPTTHGPSIT